MSNTINHDIKNCPDNWDGKWDGMSYWVPKVNNTVMQKNKRKRNCSNNLNDGTILSTDEIEAAEILITLQHEQLNPPMLCRSPHINEHTHINISLPREGDVYDNLGRNESAQIRRQELQHWVFIDMSNDLLGR